MTQTVHAIYKGGVFKPVVVPEGIMEDEEVEITVVHRMHSGHPLMQFLGVLSKEEACEMEKVIENEFERINPDEWND